MAPRSLLTTELAQQIVDYAAEGKSDSWISVTLDLSLDRVGVWLRRGREQSSGPCHDLARRVDMARNPERVLTGGELPDGVTLRKRGGKKEGRLPHPAKMPRPRGGLLAVKEITPELHDSIVAALNRGSYLNIAASASGVPPKVALRWLAKGTEETEGPYAEFAAAVMTSNAAAQNKLVGRAWDLTECGDPRVAKDATQWLLSTRYGEQWADRMNRDARQTISYIMSVFQDEISPEQYSAVLQRLSGSGGGAIEEAITGSIAGCLTVGE